MKGVSDGVGGLVKNHGPEKETKSEYRRRIRIKIVNEKRNVSIKMFKATKRGGSQVKYR